LEILVIIENAFAAGLKSDEPARELLLDKMSSEVSVSGVMVKNGGVQMIYVDSVK
jgi:hypothetical protein